MAFVVQHDGLINGDLNVQSNNSLILQNTANDQSVSIQALSGLASTYTLTLPPAVSANAGYVLTDALGDGVLSWTDPGHQEAVGGAGALQFAGGSGDVDFTGSTDLTYDGTSLKLTDSKDITIGTDDDLVMTHTGTAGSITNTTGDFTISSSSGNVVVEGITFAGGLMSGLSTPSGDSDAVPKSYVDGAINGLSWKDQATQMSTAELSTANYDLLVGAGLTAATLDAALDGVTVAVDQRVLLKNQGDTGASLAVQNGVYVITSITAGGGSDVIAARSDDMDVAAGASGSAIWIDQGTTYGDQGWTCTSDAGSDVVGTDGLAFAKFSANPLIAPGGADTAVQFNNGGVFTGSSDLTWDGTSLKLADSKDITIGTDDDLVMTHNGSDGSITSATGALTLKTSGTSSGDNVLIRCGTDTGNTKIAFYAGATEVMSISDNIYVFDNLIMYDDKGLYFGNGGADGNIVSNGSSVTWTHVTGDLAIDNTNATGATVLRLGDDAAATAVQIKNNSDAVVMSFDSEGKLGLTDTGAGTNQVTLKAGDGTTAVTAHTLVLPPTLGSAGFVLTDTAGDGVLSWVDPGHEEAVGGTNALQIASGTDFTGTQDLTYDGTSLKLIDGKDITIGTDDDLVMTHDGSDGSISSATGALTLRTTGTSAGDNLLIRCGTNTGNTKISLYAGATEVISFSDKIYVFDDLLVYDNKGLYFGNGGADGGIVSNGSSVTWTHATGDLTFDNTNATGATVLRLGDDSAATAVQIKNNSDAVVMSFDSEGKLGLTDTGAGTNQITLKAGDGTTAVTPHTLVLPPALGTAGFVLTDAAGDGVLSWADPGHEEAVGGTNALQIASGTDFTGTQDLTYDGTSLKLIDGKDITIGTDDDLVMTHTGVAGLLTNSVGDFTIASSAGNVVVEGITFNAGLMTGLSAPTNDSDAVPKVYVDNAINGLSWKDQVTQMSTAELSTANYNLLVGAGLTAATFDAALDGVTVAVDQRVLLKNQGDTGASLAVQNGVYVITSITAGGGSDVIAVRSDDMAAASGASGAAIWIDEGTTYGDQGWTCTSDIGSDVVGTDGLAFAKFSANQLVVPGGADTAVQFNSGGTFTGSSDLTWDGTNLKLADNKSLVIGSGSDFTISHTPENTSMTSITGNITLDNTSTTSSIIMSLGTDTSATAFDVQNDSGSSLFNVDGAGDVTITGSTTANNISVGDDDIISLGDSSQLSLKYQSSNSSSIIQNNTPVMSFVVDNASTPSMYFKTATTDGFFRFQNSSSASVVEINATANRLTLPDGTSLSVGSSHDLAVVHDGTNTSMTNKTGNLTIDNTNVTGSTIMQLGTDTDATAFDVKNNTGTSLLTVDGAGDVTSSGDLTTKSVTVSDKGSVTQITSVATGVTLNTYAGKITTFDLGTIESHERDTFTVTNSACAADSIVLCNIIDYTGTTDRYLHCGVDNISAGSFDIVLMNSSGYTLDGTVVIGFVVI